MKYLFFILLVVPLPLYAATPVGITVAKDVEILWVIFAGALVFFMQAGFLMLETGLVRAKNTINVAIKNLTDFIIGAIGYLIIGFGIMFGLSESGLFGSSLFMLQGYDSPQQYAFFFFQLTFMATAATIVSGAVAERMRFGAYVIVSFAISFLIYPVFGHWSWGGGWLAQMGFADFAGSTVVHSVGGWIALAGVIVLGPRKGRFNADGTSNTIYGHNLPSAVLGAMILWFGWIGFNGGSTLAINSSVAGIIVNTFISASAGGVAALFLSWAFFARKASVEDTVNGTLAGLVAITAGCNVVSLRSALIIGLVSGVLVVVASRLLEKAKIDDVVGAFPVHGVNGIWGTLATALFVKDPNSGISFSVQFIGAAACAAWAFISGFVLFMLLKMFMKIRVNEHEEEIGLNIAEHNAKTTILEFMNELSTLLSNKDFRKGLTIEHETEAGTIGLLLNTFITEFSRIVTVIKDSAFALSHDSDHLNNMAKEITSRIERQTQLVTDFKTFLHDMFSGLNEVEKMSQKQEEKMISVTEMSQKISTGFSLLESKLTDSKQSTDSLVDLFNKNEQELLQAAQNIRQMNKLTDKVNEMVVNISDISDQLNMLGINASIEAARTGKEGEGFAIVASEIGKLATRAAGNSDQAGKFLSEINRSVKDEINEINSTVNSFKNIYSEITDLVGNITSAQQESKEFAVKLNGMMELYEFVRKTSSSVIKMMEESIGIVDSVISAMQEIDGHTDNLNTQIHNLEGTSFDLQGKSEILKQLISEFKITENEENGQVDPDEKEPVIVN